MERDYCVTSETDKLGLISMKKIKRKKLYDVSESGLSRWRKTVKANKIKNSTLRTHENHISVFNKCYYEQFYCFLVKR